MPRKKNEFKLDVISVRLVKDAPIFSNHKIVSPEDAVDVIGKQLCEMDREVVCVINLKTDGTPINCHFVSMGALNEAMVHPRELFKASILSNAANMILVHCHPSGSLKPSKEDIKVTDQLIQLCGLMKIPLLDHIIVAGDNHEYFSFQNKGIMRNPYHFFSTDYKELEFKAPEVSENVKKR
jgi:DNA repair protein RadC